MLLSGLAFLLVELSPRKVRETTTGNSCRTNHSGARAHTRCESSSAITLLSLNVAALGQVEPLENRTIPGMNETFGNSLGFARSTPPPQLRPSRGRGNRG